VSGVRRLLREAGRAATCVRRLDQSLDLLRQVASPGASTLIGAEQRLELLTSAADPFGALAQVIDRAGTRNEPDALRPGIARRPANAATPFARGIQPAVAYAAGAIAAAPLEPGRFTVARQNPVPTTPARLVNSRVRSPRPAGSDPAVSHPGVIPPEPATMRDVSRVSATAAAKADAVTRRDAAASQPGGVSPQVTAADAAGIFVERMRAAMTLDAFRTIVRVSSPADGTDVSASAYPEVRRVEPRTADEGGAGDPAPGSPWRVPLAATSVDRVKDATPSIRSARRTNPQADVPQLSNVQDDERDAPGRTAAHDVEPLPTPGGRPSWFTGDPRLTGLRHLAALATESLGEPATDEPPVRAVRSSEPAMPLDEELERILRSEALSHGIDVDGPVR
jgi:hypothetical protein